MDFFFRIDPRETFFWQAFYFSYISSIEPSRTAAKVILKEKWRFQGL